MLMDAVLIKNEIEFGACPRCGSKELVSRNKILGSGVDKYIKCKDCKLEQYGNSWEFLAWRWNTPKEIQLDRFVNTLKRDGNLYIGQYMRDLWNDDAAIENYLSEKTGGTVKIRECRLDTVGCVAERRLI